MSIAGLLSRGVKTVFLERRLPWRLTHLGGFWNTSALVPLRRLVIPRWLAWSRRHDRDDVTVVMGVKNRCDHRLRHALRSIRAQTYPRDLTHITVVDYDSTQDQAALIRKLCSEAEAAYVRVENKPIWNRPHCLNVGIRRATTKYTMTTDNDVLLSRNYLEEAVKELRRDPFQVIYNQMLDLPEGLTDFLTRETGDLDLDSLRQAATPRTAGDMHQSINITLSWFFRRIRGYDEQLPMWGADDNDLEKRFTNYGLRSKTLKARAFYLHQWHPRFEAMRPAEEVERQYLKNMDYVSTTHALVRNRGGWGEL